MQLLNMAFSLLQFYVDVTQDAEYQFYYNMEAEINEAVRDELGLNNVNNLPITNDARTKNALGISLPKRGNSTLGIVSSYNNNTGQMELHSAKSMRGITAPVSKELAAMILARAIYYCPKDTGKLASSGRIEVINENECRIFFDCDYAWYVHEHTWKNHKYPTCAKFLTLAIQEITHLKNAGKL